jgi:hypothetical protein
VTVRLPVAALDGGEAQALVQVRPGAEIIPLRGR